VQLPASRSLWSRLFAKREEDEADGASLPGAITKAG